MGISDDGLTISGSREAINFTLPPPVITIIGEDGRTPLITINPNGTLEYGPDYTPDEAARRFWDAMRYLAPARCERCGHVPHQGI